MSKILVTGANGFLGKHVVSKALASGLAVRAAVRRASDGVSEKAETYAIGDLRNVSGWSDALAGIDFVIHVAGRAHMLREDAADPLEEFRKVNTEATLALAKAASACGVRRFVFISSIGVNGKATTGKAFRSGDVPAPHSPYALSKWEAEQGLHDIAAAGSMETVILRPPMILADEPKGNLALIHKAILKGIPLPFGLVTRNRRSFISAERLASISIACLSDDRAANATLTVADPYAVSTNAFARAEARRLGVKYRSLPVPPALLNIGLRVLGKGDMAGQLTGDLEVDGSLANSIAEDFEKRIGGAQ